MEADQHSTLMKQCVTLIEQSDWLCARSMVAERSHIYEQIHYSLVTNAGSAGESALQLPRELPYLIII